MNKKLTVTEDVTYVMYEVWQKEIYLHLFTGNDEVNYKMCVDETRSDFEETLKNLQERFVTGGDKVLKQSGFDVDGKTVYKLAKPLNGVGGM